MSDNFESYTQILQCLKNIIQQELKKGSLDKHDKFNKEDYDFFSKASEALLIQYWDNYDTNRRSKLKKELRLLPKDDTLLSSRFLFLERCLAEVIQHIYKQGKGRANPVDKIGFLYPSVGESIAGYSGIERNNGVRSSGPISDCGGSGSSSSSSGATKGVNCSDLHEFVSALNALNYRETSSDGQNRHFLEALSQEYPDLPLFKTKTSAASSAVPDTLELGKVYKCEKCKLSFKRSNDLVRHSKIHLAVLPHICNLCGKSFARRDALKRHYNTLTCNRNKENQTYIENLKFLTEEELREDLSVTRKRQT